MDEETCLALIELRLQMPALTVPQLIEQIEPAKPRNSGNRAEQLNGLSVLHQQNLMAAQMKKPVDRRKFEAELPNDLWQSDVMHGPKVDVNARCAKLI